MATESKKKKTKKNIPLGIAHVNATFNNTIITITDTKGNTIAWSSAGAEGFKGSRKSTPFAAQLAAENAGKKAKDNGVKTLEIEVRGPGSGRESALRALQSTGFIITSIPKSLAKEENDSLLTTENTDLEPLFFAIIDKIVFI